jgi:hypothetical protein
VWQLLRVEQIQNGGRCLGNQESVHFEFLTIFLIFILVAILKIFKTKSTTLSDDLFLCQVSKGSAVWS